MDCLDNNLFHADWSVAEELLLLEGIERFGMGNWKAIAEYISDPKGPFTKTTKQCEEHYWEDYMGRFGRCLPIPKDHKTSDEIQAYLKDSDISEEEINVQVQDGHTRGSFNFFCSSLFN